MKKYVVLAEKWDEDKRRNIEFEYYVEANNKMDAVRTFLEELETKTYRLHSWTTRWDNYKEGCVFEYEEPVFHKRCDDYDGGFCEYMR